jgi:hypothetical protein
MQTKTSRSNSLRRANPLFKRPGAVPRCGTAQNMFRAALALCLAALAPLFVGRAYAQGSTTVGGATTIPSGAALPAACDPALAGDNNHFFYKTAAPNQGFYSCTAANTWTQGGSGPANAAIKPATGDSILYASTAGSDGNDGLSWGTAKLTPSAALTALGSGGTLYLGAGTFSFSSGLSTTASNLRIIGAGSEKTILSYTGSGIGLQVGNTSAFTYSLHLEGFELTLASAGNAATALKLQDVFSATLMDVKIITVKGGTGTSQIAYNCDGTGNFGTYITWVTPFISGDFLKGVDYTGPTSTQGCNATTFVGGSIVNTTSPRATGTKGVHYESGNTNTAWGTDLEGWDIGVQAEANAAGNGPLAFRFESNNTAWKTIAGSNSNNFTGGSWPSSTISDNATATVYQAVTNGGSNITQLQATQIGGSTTLAGTFGFTSALGSATDVNFTRLGANTLKLDSELSGQVNFGSLAFASRAGNVGDTNDRWRVLGGGEMDWGSGTAAPDTTLQRQAAGMLQTTGSFTINTHLNQNAANGDIAGTVTLSSGTKTVTFVTAFTSTPVCVVSDETAVGAARVSAKSATSITISGGSTDIVDYICVGNPN